MEFRVVLLDNPVHAHQFLIEIKSPTEICSNTRISVDKNSSERTR